MFSSMFKNMTALMKRLNSTDDRLTVNTSSCLKSNYFFSWFRSVSLEVVLETEADDGWGEVIAEGDNDMIAVFGTCSHHTEAREATASFSWEEAPPTGERSTRQRKRVSSGSDGPPVPTHTKIVARTGSFVVFEHKGMYVRGLALYFLLYLPPKGTTPATLTEFRGQVVLVAYVYVALLNRNCLVVRVQPAARSLPAPAHEPLLTAQAVYTSKQMKLDCLPEGRVLDFNHIKAWNTHVNPTITEQAVLDNSTLWADVVGRRDKASSIAHNVATMQRSAEDLKRLGVLTNSLPIKDVDADGADVDAEGADDETVQLQVTVHPDNIRKFLIHCRLGEAQVAHEWAVTALASVRDFDYKTSSLPKYTMSSVDAVVVVGENENSVRGGAASKPKNKAKTAYVTDAQVLKYLIDKGNLQPPAARMSLGRLSGKIDKHRGSFRTFEPTPDETMWLRMTDLVLAGKTNDLPAWIVTPIARRMFKKVAQFRTAMRGCSWLWAHRDVQLAVTNWYGHIGMVLSSEDESDSEQEAGEPAAASQAGSSTKGPPPPRSARQQRSPAPNGGPKPKANEQPLLDPKGTPRLETGLSELFQASVRIETALKEMPAKTAQQVAKTRPVAASPGEQDPADAAKKLQAALSAINHLAQDFHQRGDMKSPCMGGVVNILKAQFTREEIKGVLGKTDMDDYY